MPREERGGKKSYPSNILHQSGHTAIVDFVGRVIGAKVVVEGKWMMRFAVIALECVSARSLQHHLRRRLIKGHTVAVPRAPLLVAQGTDLPSVIKISDGLIATACNYFCPLLA
jgi:hypothetical protein